MAFSNLSKARVPHLSLSCFVFLKKKHFLHLLPKLVLISLLVQVVPFWLAKQKMLKAKIVILKNLAIFRISSRLKLEYTQPVEDHQLNYQVPSLFVFQAIKMCLLSFNPQSDLFCGR